MKKILFFLFIAFSLNLFAQKEYHITINSHILDKNTKLPIYNANVGFLNKNVGTLSDRKGNFKFVYNEKEFDNNDTLRVSASGYLTKDIIVSDLYKHLSKSNILFLEPKLKKTYSQKKNSNKIEYIENHYGTFGLQDIAINAWSSNLSIGSEIASKININSHNTRLKELQFKVLNHKSENTIIRINIYNVSNGLPNEKIIDKNIYHILRSKKGIETIDLKPYNIIVNEDVIISLELIKTHSEKFELELEANAYSSKNYKKNYSHGKWNISNDQSITFKLLTAHQKTNPEILIAKPDNIILYWDTSLSMKKNRNLYYELDLICKYLKKLKTVSIKVSKFSDKVNESKTFNIDNGNSKELIRYLQSNNYEGATNYAPILKNNDANAKSVLLFTDGISILEQLNSTLNIPVYCITSGNEINENKLKQTAYQSNGNYINLNKITPERALIVFSKKISYNTLYENSKIKKISKNTITGIVKDYNEQPIQGVTVRKKNSFNETLTDSLGYYNIAIAEGETLTFTYSGLEPKEVLVTSAKKLNTQLSISKNVLDEVVIKAKRRKETIYEKEKRKAAGSINTYIGSEDIPNYAISIGDILRRIPGINVRRNGASVSYTSSRSFEPGKQKPILFIIDGLPTTDPSFVTVTSIDHIIILKTLASTIIYGTQGAGGVIKINTKNSIINKDENGKIIDMALITGNNYTEKVPLISTKKESSPYLKELNNAKSLDEALHTYNNLKKNTQQKGIPFYIDTAEYFLKWDKTLSYSILQNISDLAYNNVQALKVLAYKYEELNKFEAAKNVYKHILKLQPNASQSYRDYAQILTLNNEHRKAFDMYKKMRENNIKNVNFEGLNEIIISELRRIMSFNKSDVVYSDLPAELINKTIKNDIRLVFEWNQPNTEFELQFVNPKNKYYEWHYSALVNPERVTKGLKNGYNMEEFIIDDSEKGEWIINVKSSENHYQFNPTYLKYTLYKNYGLPNETKVTRLLKLYQLHEKITIDKFNN